MVPAGAARHGCSLSCWRQAAAAGGVCVAGSSGSAIAAQPASSASACSPHHACPGVYCGLLGSPAYATVLGMMSCCREAMQSSLYYHERCLCNVDQKWSSWSLDSCTGDLACLDRAAPPLSLD